MRSESSTKVRVLCTACCFVLFVFSGCNNVKKLPSADVQGSVTLNGQPFTGAAVHFYNPEIGGGAFNLNEDGTFVSDVPLTVGEYMVALDRPGPIEGETPSDIEWPESNVGEVPKQYLSSRESGFVARVSADANNNFKFEMQGKAKGNKETEGPTPFQPVNIN